jgi:nitroreductase
MQMEFMDVLKKRQSIRRYKEGKIPQADLRKIIEAAGMAPSGKNIQNWHFVVIQDPIVMEKIAEIVTEKNRVVSEKMDWIDSENQIDAEKGSRFRKFCKNFTVFFTKASALVVVYSTFYPPSGYYEYLMVGMDPETELVHHRNPGMQSLGAALENFSLRAVDLGYGSCWLTSANYAASEIEDYLKASHGFEKKDFFLAALMSVGIPEDNQRSPEKKPIDEICTFLE